MRNPPIIAAWTVASVILVGVSMAAEPKAEGSAVTIVLDTTSFWHIHNTFKGAEIIDGGAVKPLPVKGPGEGRGEAGVLWAPLMAPETAVPPADWAKPECEDAGWVRGPAKRAARTPFLSQLFLRGKFAVTDPAKVKDLRLVIEYHGGAVVYLNGEEIGRADLAKGAATADAYPSDAFVDSDGKLITIRGDEQMWKQKPSAEVARRIASRERKLAIAVPAKTLRPGLNVLAIQIVRAPYDKAVDEQKGTSLNHGKHEVYELSWNTCEIRRVQLTSAAADGLVPGATRPEGFQVWNSNPMVVDYDLDFGDAATLGPITLAGARGGAYSGKVVVGCDKPIRGLVATAGDLKGDTGGTIPAGRLRIRYGMPWGETQGNLTNPSNNEVLPYPAEPMSLLALVESAPAEVPVYRKGVSARSLKLPGQPAPVFGAVVPVWVTVAVPPDAKAGSYSGELAIRAEGWQGVKVPLKLTVADWTAPDPQHHRTWVELVEAPDTVAVEYELPLWSDAHWRMIEKSMSFLGQVGSRVLFVPLIAQTNIGNEQSMVRWIKKDDGTYSYDFSIMDKYLDLGEKQMGKPRVVIFHIWDRYLGLTEMRPGYWKRKAEPPLVTVFDPGTGKAENAAMPSFTDANAEAVWKPLFDQLKQKMKGRGLEDAINLGMTSDFWPTKEQAAFLKDITGNLPWANAGHYTRKTLYNGLARFGYQASYFGVAFGYFKSRGGWKNPELQAVYERGIPLDAYPLTRWRTLPELCVTGSSRGFGRVGADTWLAVKDKTGARRARVWDRYPANLHGFNADTSALAPGPDGPVATHRFEAIREGIQECEARIVIEEALGDKASVAKLGPELTKKCEDLLLERMKDMWRGVGVWQAGADFSHEVSSWRERQGVTGDTWYVGSGWQERSGRLYMLAAEVERKLARE